MTEDSIKQAQQALIESEQFHRLKPGDIVKLREPYLNKWGFGLVACINAHTCRTPRRVRNVALHLYDGEGKLYFHEPFIEKGVMVPAYVDFHVSELTLYAIAESDSIHLVKNPPDWTADEYLG